MTLSDRFHELLSESETRPSRLKELVRAVRNAPDSPEREGLLALMYHEGIGVEADLDRCFAHAERAAAGRDGLGWFMLGYMCDNIETPDQAEGGPRQKYDHYDAERFYELCAGTDSRWAPQAHLWLGDYYMDFARGGDPEVGAEHYEAVADSIPEAAEALSDYYWGIYAAGTLEEEEARKLYKYTLEAVQGNPHDYSYRMGCLYAEGTGLPAPEFRLARKYWEDAYEFGEAEAADAIAELYAARLAGLGSEASEDERARCRREIDSWRKLAERTRKRQEGQ